MVLIREVKSSSLSVASAADEGDRLCRDGDNDGSSNGGDERRRRRLDLELDAAEARAERAVSEARAVVEAVRNYDRKCGLPASAADGGSLRARTGVSAARRHEEDNGGRGGEGDDVSMMSHLRSLGLVIPSDDLDFERTRAQVDGDDDERTVLVRRVLLPRVRAMASCYSDLDRLLSSKPQQRPVRADDDRGPNPRPAVVRRRGRRGGGAPPPRGLLSLSDYADIACLLELLVCASILPNLDDHVLDPSTVRMKLLPKSLAGRMPRRLVSTFPLFRVAGRGGAGAGAGVNVGGEESSSEESSSTAARRATATTAMRARGAEAARDELRDSAEAIARLCSLDRFKPMLLPRHLSDLYAAWFQADHLDDLLLQLRSHSRSSAGPTTRGSGGPRVVVGGTEELLMPWRRGRGRPTDDLTSVEADAVVVVVDDRTAVPALQRLLLRGTSAPRWLKVRVNSVLAEVASLDLSAVMDAFVTAAARSPGADVSAAAARLAHALVNSGGGEEDRDRYLRSICDQLVTSLSLSSSSSSSSSTSAAENGDGAAAFDPGPITAAAVLPLLPTRHRRYLLSEVSKGLMRSDAPRSGTQIAAAVRGVRRLVRATPPGLHPESDAVFRSLAGLGDGGEGDDREGRCFVHGGDSVLGGLVGVAAGAPLAACAGEAVDAAVAILEGLIASSSSSSSSESGRGRRDAAMCLMKAVAGSNHDASDGGRPTARFRPSSDGGCELAIVVGNGDDDAEAAGAEFVEASICDLQSRAAVAVRAARMVGRGGSSRSTSKGASGSNEDDDGDVTDSEQKAKAKRRPRPLSADLFRLLLSTYLETLSSGGGRNLGGDYGGNDGDDGGGQGGASTATTASGRDRVPPFLGGRWGRTAALAVLATLLEECGEGAPDELLLGGSDGGDDDGTATGVFIMIGSVISATATSVASADGDDGHGDSPVVVVAPLSDGAEGQDRDDDERLDSLLSTCSVCIGLLVALLELGNPRRSTAEEDAIRSLGPDLEALARWSSQGEDTVGFGASEAAGGRVAAEVGEMAAHACALIASRGCDRRPADDDDSACEEGAVEDSCDHDESPSIVIERRIQSVEVDLGSDVPPVRARGVVALHRVARAVTEASREELLGCGGTGTTGPLVVEVERGVDDLVASDDASFPPRGERGRADLADRLLGVALSALDDDESYVYLAAVQALSAIADFYPERVMPTLAIALSQGAVSLAARSGRRVKGSVGDCEKAWRGDDDAAAASGGEWERTCRRLSRSQRAKVAEALLLAIRRRGTAIGHHAKTLMEELVRGCASHRGGGDVPEASSSSAAADAVRGMEADASEVARSIQRRTDSYFMNGTIEDVESTDDAGGKPDEDYHDDDAEDMILQERQLRLRAGGPLFESEEDDAIRSGCYSCLAEVLAMLPTTLIAPHGCRIVRLCTESLRLDVSRPVRRGAALLARELYESILREAGEDVETSSNNRAGSDHLLLPLTVAVVSSGEARLRSTLERCVNRTGDAVVDRYHDPSTTARCHEALRTRTTAEERGILSVAALLVAKRLRESAASRSVRELLSRGEEAKDLDGSARAMSSLVFDADTLELG